MSKNLRVVLLFGGFMAAVGAAFYPIYFRPLIYTQDYLVYKFSRDHMPVVFLNFSTTGSRTGRIRGAVPLLAKLVELPEQEQKVNRTGINQEEIQPGGMKVWSDPFNRK